MQGKISYTKHCYSITNKIDAEEVEMIQKIMRTIYPEKSMVYGSQLQSRQKPERRRLVKLVRETHNELQRYRCFVPSPYGECTREDYREYEEMSSGKKDKPGIRWDKNPFHVAEEFVLYSHTASEQPPLKLAAFASQYRPDYYVKEIHPFYLPRMLLAYLATEHVLQPEDFNRCFQSHKKAAKHIGKKVKPPKPGLLSEVDFLPEVSEEEKPRGFQEFIDLYLEIVDEASACMYK